MKAKISLPNGAHVEVDASPEEIRRLAGEPGYKLELLPIVPLPICLCGRAYVSAIPPVCPVHGIRTARVTFRPLPLVVSSGAAMPWGSGSWIGTVGGQA